jgi:hypothetical protein
MNQLAQAHQAKSLWPILHKPPELSDNAVRWRINGFPATIIIWKADEWEHLSEHPADAQHFPCGIWCALRME